MNLRTAARIARRDLRGGTRSFTVFLLCLLLGVAAIAAVGTVRDAVEGAEDDAEQGAEDLRAIGLSARDVVVGIAVSGKTPYVLGALDFAREPVGGPRRPVGAGGRRG